MTEMGSNELGPRSDNIVSGATCRLLQFRHAFVALTSFEPAPSNGTYISIYTTLFVIQSATDLYKGLTCTPKGVAGVRFYLRLSVCLSVFFPHDISKTDAARITKLDKEMFRDKSFLEIYLFRSKGLKVKVASQETIAGVGLCNLLTNFSCECWLLLMYQLTLKQHIPLPRPIKPEQGRKLTRLFYPQYIPSHL